MKNGRNNGSFVFTFIHVGKDKVTISKLKVKKAEPPENDWMMIREVETSELCLLPTFYLQVFLLFTIGH